MGEFVLPIEHTYNIIFVKTTRNESRALEELITLSKMKQDEEDTVITEISRLHYHNKELTSDAAVELFDFIETCCEDYMGSSVYINGEKQHIEKLTELIDSNPNRFNFDVQIKVLSDEEYIVLKEGLGHPEE